MKSIKRVPLKILTVLTIDTLHFSTQAAGAQLRLAAPAGAPGVPAAGEPGYGINNGFDRDFERGAGFGEVGNPVGAPGVPAAGAPGYGAAGDGANLGGPVNRRGPR
jgi:hypothetical protein